MPRAAHPKTSKLACLAASAQSMPTWHAAVLAVGAVDIFYKRTTMRTVPQSLAFPTTIQFRFAYVPNYTGYVASIGDVALIAQLVSQLVAQFTAAIPVRRVWVQYVLGSTTCIPAQT